MRRDIEFSAEGTTLRGWLYLAQTGPLPAPAIIMAHGFTGVKEQGLDKYAEVFAAAGLAVLVYDNRCFGASDGLPRQEVDPAAAGTRLSTRHHVRSDPARGGSRSHRHMGYELQRGPCPRRRCNRSPREVCRLASSGNQRLDGISASRTARASAGFACPI